jgi:hypothetical protein
MSSNNTVVRNVTDKDISEVLLLLKELGYNTEDTSDLRNTWNEIIADQRMGIIAAITNDAISGYLA